jgi:ribosomal protein L32
MRKLSADEGAVHLEGSAVTETGNAIHTIEYDVWVDDKSGEKRIEKYFVHQHANKCEECGYYTMMVDSEEIVKQPNLQESGTLIEHYQCTYCSHREAKQVAIAPISSNLAGA